MKSKVKVRDSDAVQDVSYDEKTKVLTVHMMNSVKGQNKFLRYGDVPKVVFESFLKANSKGRFFNQEIRNTFPFLGSS